MLKKSTSCIVRNVIKNIQSETILSDFMHHCWATLRYRVLRVHSRILVIGRITLYCFCIQPWPCGSK